MEIKWNLLIFSLLLLSSFSNLEIASNEIFASSQLSIPVTILLQALDDRALLFVSLFIELISNISHQTVSFDHQSHAPFEIRDIVVFHRNSSQSFNMIYDRSLFPENNDLMKDNGAVTFFPLIRPPLPDKRIAKGKIEPERVTDIISTWKYFLNLKSIRKRDNGILVSLAFSETRIPIATSSFVHLIYQILHHSERNVVLLGKTRRLTSVSDWNDLAVAVFRINDKSTAWLRTVENVYKIYSTTKSLNMLDPRPSLLEAAIKHTVKLGFYYLTVNDICSLPVSLGNLMKGFENNERNAYKHIFQSIALDTVDLSKYTDIDSLRVSQKHDSTSMCSSDRDTHPNKVSPAIKLLCITSDPAVLPMNCLTVDVPLKWMEKTSKHIPKRFKNEEKGLKDPMNLMWQGVSRFRHYSPDSQFKTKLFCWEDRKNSNIKELLSRSKVDNYDTAEPFTHPNYTYYSEHKSNISAIILVGSVDGSARVMDMNKYMTLSKMYYAKRHGYDFLAMTSDEILPYFPPDMFSNMPSPYFNGDSQYSYGVLTKPLMILDTMYRHYDNEWIIYNDDDTFINTGWLYLPMDAFLSDVPAHKFLVLSNYRSAFTNVLAVRNDRHGRKLVMQWLIVAMSGYIQCHGFDQAALQFMILQRLSDDFDFKSITPLNFTCLFNQSNSKMGCNLKGDWSCDYKYEQALYNAGYRTKPIDTYTRNVSSFSKGCANDHILDFHVITESKLRPRFQCGLCSRLSEIESAGHWDGPLGGGNLPILRGNINGYFFNHKVEFLFYESYLRPRACQYIGEIVPVCHYDQNSFENSTQFNSHAKHIVSLTDGYGLDLNQGIYCKIIDESVIDLQMQTTYMASYNRIREVVGKIQKNEWLKRYAKYDVGFGRKACDSSKDECHEEDGQYKRKKTIHQYDSLNYCESCLKISSPNNPFNIKTIVDCFDLE